MARWKALPVGLDPAAVRLVVELRRVKDASGLTLRQVAARTGYSTSSWDRYLGGRLLPPREAVEALAAACGEDSVRLAALCDAAGDTWGRGLGGGVGGAGDASASGSAAALASASASARASASTAAADAGAPAAHQNPAAVAATAGETGDDLTSANVSPGTGRAGLARQLLTIITSAAAGALLTILFIQPGHGAAAAATSPVAVAKRAVYTCTFVQRDGQWYAGNSDTISTNLVVDMSGPDVAELQCLLQHAGITPGGIDGQFGPLTEAAVIKAQKAFHLDVDGQVGPHTWAALRK